MSHEEIRTSPVVCSIVSESLETLAQLWTDGVFRTYRPGSMGSAIAIDADTLFATKRSVQAIAAAVGARSDSRVYATLTAAGNATKLGTALAQAREDGGRNGQTYGLFELIHKAGWGMTEAEADALYATVVDAYGLEVVEQAA